MRCVEREGAPASSAQGVAASTNVGERLLEPVLALPEAPVNFEDLSFVDHPPTAATLLLLADEPVSEDEDF